MKQKMKQWVCGMAAMLLLLGTACGAGHGIAGKWSPLKTAADTAEDAEAKSETLEITSFGNVKWYQDGALFLEGHIEKREEKTVLAADRFGQSETAMLIDHFEIAYDKKYDRLLVRPVFTASGEALLQFGANLAAAFGGLGSLAEEGDEATTGEEAAELDPYFMVGAYERNK